jgi:hypothetical protein
MNLTIENSVDCRLPRRIFVSTGNKKTTPPFTKDQKYFFQKLLGQ